MKAGLVSKSATYFLVYLPVYASESLGLGSTAGFGAALLAGCVLFALTPIFGAMSDRIPMLTAALLMALIAATLVHMLARRPTAQMLIFAVLCLAVVKAVYQGSLAGFLSELFCDDNKKYLSTDLTKEEPVKPVYLTQRSNILAWLTPVAIILVMVLGGMAMANRKG
jgi:hypothetical protein